jgi:hypothetical protein
MAAECQERLLTFVNCGFVTEAADRFRARAKQCRTLARDARNDEARKTLIRMAEELEAEAAEIDSKENAPEQP